MYTLSNYYRKFIDRIGGNSEKIYKKLGLPLNAVLDINISVDTYVNLMNEISHEFDSNLLLEVFDFDKFTEFIPAIYSALCAENGLEAGKRVTKYKKLIGPFMMEIYENENEVKISFYFEDNTEIPKIALIMENIIIINLLRRGTGEHIVPIEIQASFEYGDDMKAFFEINPIVSDENSMTFKLEDMKKPFISKNNIMWSYLEPEFKRRLEEMEVDESVAAKVRTILFEVIPSGNGNIEEVSRQMALSPRTLQRKLSDENTSFIKQLNHTKELLAKNLLLNTITSY